jgi:signal peptidase II
MLKNILIIIGVILLDQLSKLYIVNKLAIYETLKLFDAKLFGLNFFLTYNNGAAFGFLHHADGWQNYLFLAVAVIVIGLILYWLINNQYKNNLEKYSYLLILGGAVGNLLDRLLYGSVVDFIDAYATFSNQSFHWYTFNIADSAICIGVALLIMGNFWVTTHS